MTNTDGANVSPPFAPTLSRIAGANTLPELTRAIADTAHTSLIPYTRCCLVLPAPDPSAEYADDKQPYLSADTHAPQLWSRAGTVPHDETSEADVRTFAAAPDSVFARLLREAAPTFLRGMEWRLVATGLYGDVTAAADGAALMLPLQAEGHCFGLLCLMHENPDAYTQADADAARWLGDLVAPAVRAVVLRARLASIGDTRRELAQLKGGFVNTLLRDVRLPLTSVLGLLDLFQSKLQAREPFDMEDRQLLATAAAQGERMRHLVDDLLEVAQQQERPLALAPCAFAASELLEEIADGVRGEAALRGIEISVSAAPDAPHLFADRRQTRRALCHLVTAALASTRHGGVVALEAHGFSGTRRGEVGRDFVLLTVADGSDGVPPEQVPFLFDSFWQAAHARDGNGSGVGLAIAKRVAAAHGGSVSARSQHGVGTIYSLVMPANSEVAEVASQGVAHAQRILIVEDTPELLLLTAKLVERMGYEVLTAADARRALAVLEAQTVDLVLTDWAMPGMDGGDLLAALKGEARWRDLPTVVITGHDTERQRARDAGCDRFLVKPVSLDQLQQTIAEMLPAAAAAAA